MVLQLYYLHFSWKNCRKNWHSLKAGRMDNAEVGSAFVAAQKRRFSVSEIALKDAAPLLCVDQDYRPEPKTKQRKKGDDFQEHYLLSFCDEILYEIFKYLDTPSIMALMHCSPRLENLLLDHRFWHGIDLSNGPLPLGILEDILGRATEKTHTIKICGPPSSQHVAGEFRQFTCTLTTVFPKVATQLKVLELQGVSLDFEYIRITQFPGSLTRLKLKDCSVKVGDQGKSIFHTIEMQLVNLEDLSIEDNNWFEPYYIMALSKLPSLRRLSLKGCQMLCKFVPYGSMAARFGFMKLEVLDLRLTPINNSDLQCFSAIENLKELLLESPLNPPPEAASPEKVNNGNDEAATSQSESLKVLNDDEPSTSRAAMEHLRACKMARGNDPNESSDAPRPCHDIFHSDPSDDTVDEPAPASSASCSRKRVCLSSESEDEDTSSASASSSDKSDSAAPRSNGHNGGIDPNAAVRSPLVVIALPGVAAVRQGMPPAADQADNVEPDEAGAGAGPVPRAYVYVPGGQGPGENPQPNMQSILEQMADHLRSFRGNNPAHSRFLPRRDQVIYMNPQAMAIREPMLVMHSARRRSLARGNFDQVVHHPMFWNMLDPLDRDYARRLRHRQASNPCPPPQYYVSDRAIYSFGRAARPVQPDVVWIRNINRSPDNRLERISLRNYQHITNHTLEHLVQCSPFLVFIDVSGTSVTVLGLRKFKELKPECEVVAGHLDIDEDAKPPEEDPEPPAPSDTPDEAPDEEQPPTSPPPPPPPPQEFEDVA
ncbi:uncharacterized protein LOC117898779 [Drosophila subobscura]|uniref:uncharacterized protein LOC117898779 n=1 Tax=Drosophila subobscura TaxID=7241 RepID=UPI00155AA542|nr:uncharacterized protein LOC117898779 [Drosophila subobscura]